MDGGGREAQDEITRPGLPVAGRGRRPRRWKDLVGHVAGDLGVGFEMGRREHEPLGEVVKAVSLGVGREPNGQME